MKNINWLAIIAAAAACMGVGFLWYGLLFQETWMAGNLITMPDESTMLKNGTEVPISNLPMIINTIAMLFFAFLMNWLLTFTGQTTAAKGGKVGLIVGVFAAVNVFLTNLFASNPLSLTAVDGSYVLVSFTLLGVILGGWRKKNN